MPTTTCDAVSTLRRRVPSFPGDERIASLEIETITTVARSVVWLRGFATPATLPAVEAELARVAAVRPAALEVRFDRTEQVVGQVLAAVVGLGRVVREAGGEVSFVNPQPHVRQMLDRMRLGDVFTVEDRPHELEGPPVALQRRRAFTIVELLVVMSIITLLISVLLPAIGKARQHAIITQCLSHQRQIGTAGFAAAADREGYFIPGYVNNSGFLVQTGMWRKDWEAYESYGLTDEIWSCPGRQFKPIDDPASTTIPHTYQYFPGATMWFNYHGMMPARSPVRLEDSTSRRTFMADSTLANNGVWGDPTQPIAEDLPVHGRTRDGSPTGANHVFADGSGAWIGFEKMQILNSWWLPYRTIYFYQEDVPEPFVSYPR